MVFSIQEIGQYLTIVLCLIDQCQFLSLSMFGKILTFLVLWVFLPPMVRHEDLWTDYVGQSTAADRESGIAQ